MDLNSKAHVKTIYYDLMDTTYKDPDHIFPHLIHVIGITDTLKYPQIRYLSF